MNEFDVVVIGGGAAGLSAALVLLRARRNVAVIDAGTPRNAPASNVHGFLTREGMSPADLVATGRSEIALYGGVLIDGTVTAVEPAFQVTLADGRTLSARRLLVATGLRDVVPDIPGVRERWGRDLLHCPYCHGYEVRDKQLGVIGADAAAVRYAQIVRQWTHDLVYFAVPATLTAEQRCELTTRAIGVVEGTIEQLVIDDDQLRGVQLDDGCVVPREAIFVPPRFVPTDQLLVSVGCAVDDTGWVVVDSTGRTSVPGVWAAGNVVDPRAQVITAAGAGSAAAIAINADLVDDDVRTAVQMHRSRT